ncbi:patatin-like phospholipase family protein [Kineosporia sp. J2-2]|uniref:Patatin-like phospholipase family protein n=1 Tax=Kineosporia corallincola TaxID=2835133 RepID=A0ABS5TSQ0_9ACTN|nr:patatin-like phospholipase family protein [Kineosporia corallincola]MBT0773803.1 patatin-like phospholipase family protein [Kineosporia corallincola]
MGKTAFVFGGGGMLGASEVGMLRAVMEAGHRPDLVLGTSVGAINGAVLAAEPTLDCVGELVATWESLGGRELFSGPLQRLRVAASTGTHLHSIEPLRALIERRLGPVNIEDLAVPFQCCASSIERAAETWFTEGPVASAVSASCAVPGMFGPVQIGGEHYLDGGLVNSLPVGRAVALGATEIFVLHVGRIEQPLKVPSRPWEVATVAFEIARRHRFAADMAAVPEGVAVRVLPAGSVISPSANLRYRNTQRVRQRIEEAYQASRGYLESLPAGGRA